MTYFPYSARLLGGIVASILFGAASGPAVAQSGKIVLRVADSFPVTHYTPPHVKFWMEQIKAQSGGAVDFEYYPAEQMGKAKDFLALTQAGTVDVSYVAPAYVPDKLPLSGVANLPGLFEKSCPASLAFWKLGQPDALIGKTELAPNGVRLVFAAALQPYQLFSSSRPLESAKSIEGMKLRSAGGVMDLTLRKMKAVPIQMASPEVYQSLSRGTLDGGVWAFTSIVAYDWGPLLKHATIGENFGSFLVTYVINENKWKQLSPAVQKAMLEAGEATTRRHCTQLEQDEQADIEKLKKMGMTITPLPKAAKEMVAKEISTVTEDWAQTWDKRGKPASTVLRSFVEAVQQAK